MKEEDIKIEMIDILHVDKDGKIYDAYGNWIACQWKRVMTAVEIREFWGKEKLLPMTIKSKMKSLKVKRQ